MKIKFCKKFIWNKKTLLPVIIKNQNNDIVMLAWMSSVSFLLTLKTGFLFFWSRRRKSIWLKGLTSKNYQIFYSIFMDCDFDCFLIKVYQLNNICCHLGKYSCFSKK